MNKHMNVHGTYPYDSNRWRKVRNLKFEEAMKLVNAKPENIEGWPKSYPWINKGYILLGIDAPSISGTVAALIEGGLNELGLKNLKQGQQAVYLHDGDFSLIEIK